jgi:hypothetical protein
MSGPAPSPQLLRSLGLLARGLSALFWGLPLAVVVSTLAGESDLLRPLGVLPPLAVAALLLYALHLLGQFQPQERPWRRALDRARVAAVLNLGLAPFIYWSSRVPGQPFLLLMVEFSLVSGLLFLLLLNPVLWRLASMLPDETLRAETRAFTRVNCWLVGVLLAGVLAWLGLTKWNPSFPDQFINYVMRVSPLPPRANSMVMLLGRLGLWAALFPCLLPLAMTMALLWKIKEVILESVFGSER